MVDVVSTAELHGIYIDTTSGAISTLHKNNDIDIDIVFSAELDSIFIIWYRPICWFNIALPLLKRFRNGVFSLIFANEVGRYLLILNDRRDVEGEFHHIDKVPMPGNISACVA